MAQNKELYTEHGEKWVMETNDFKYYMHLKRLKYLLNLLEKNQTWFY